MASRSAATAILLMLCSCGPSTLEIHAVSAHHTSRFLKEAKTVIDAYMVESGVAVGRQWQGHPDRDLYIEMDQRRFSGIVATHAAAIAAWEIWVEALALAAMGGDLDLGAAFTAGRRTVEAVYGLVHDYFVLTSETLPEPGPMLLDVLDQ